MSVLPIVSGDRRMRITIPCGCKFSLNKKKKILTVLKLCYKHTAELKDRIHNQIWYGCYWKDVVKQYTDFMDEHGTIQVSPRQLFWLQWLEQQRNKALRLPVGITK